MFIKRNSKRLRHKAGLFVPTGDNISNTFIFTVIFSCEIIVRVSVSRKVKSIKAMTLLKLDREVDTAARLGF